MSSSEVKEQESRYNYPDANPMIVCNIARACLHHPKFYHRVLHMMNTMNLIPPFNQIPDQFQDDLEEIIVNSVESSESEVEVDEYVVNVDWSGKSFKHLMKQKARILKEVSVENSNNQQPKADSKHAKENENTFEPVRGASLTNGATKTNTNPELSTSQATDETPKLAVDCDKKPSENGQSTSKYDKESDNWFNQLITDEEIQSNRISHEELCKVVAAHDYFAGSPSCYIHVKNLDEKVTVYDLKRLYGRYINLENETDKNEFQIYLSGADQAEHQALIIFPNKTAAWFAIEETYGYKLKGKPIIVSHG